MRRTRRVAAELLYKKEVAAERLANELERAARMSSGGQAGREMTSRRLKAARRALNAARRALESFWEM